jgi:tetratricopeptide (TPR) repeat protein
MIKKLSLLLFAFAVCTRAFSQGISLPPSADNEKSSVTQWIGPVAVTITYNSPNVHAPNGDDRTGHIWGELVHYGLIDQGFGTSKAAPWRAGANENTTITFSHPVKVEGKDIAAGTYGLFLEVAKDGPWTWIFSKNSTSWGSYFYNPAEDALRVQINAVDAPFTEFLTYSFDDRLSNSTTAFLQWEKKKVPFKIEVPNVNDLYVSMIRNELRSSPGFDTRNYQAAAAFCARNKINLEEALAWADGAMNPQLGGTEDFSGLSTKALVLTAMGKGQEASAVMDKAIKLPSARITDIHQYGRTLLGMGQNQKALEVFQFNAKTHPEEKFTTFVGLARGYQAVGNKKEAIKNWEIALKNVPQGQEANKPVWENELKKLKEGK